MREKSDIELWRGAPGWKIWPDQRITRRKLFHVILTPSGEIAFRSRLLWECIEYLDAMDVKEYEFAWGGPDNPPLSCVVLKKKEQ